MNYASIKSCDIANGPGVRVSLFVSGCTHHCKDCFNEEAWDFSYGEPFTDEVSDRLLAMLCPDYIRGITYLGGEPFDQAAELAEFAAEAHRLGKTVLTFTGYTYAFLQNGDCAAHHALLDQTDLLIDGKFEQSLTDYSRPLVGSSNQRFLFLTDAIPPQEIAAYKNRFEIRTDAAGRVTVNGMGNIEKLKQYTATIEGVQYG